MGKARSYDRASLLRVAQEKPPHHKTEHYQKRSGMAKKELRLTARIPRDLNSQLNEFCGKTGLFRSQVERLAVADFIGNTNRNRQHIARLLRGQKLPVIEL